MDKAGLCKATIASFGAAVLLTAGLATTAFADEKDVYNRQAFPSMKESRVATAMQCTTANLWQTARLTNVWAATMKACSSAEPATIETFRTCLLYTSRCVSETGLGYVVDTDAKN